MAYIVNSKNQLVELDGQSDEGPKLVKENCNPNELFSQASEYLSKLFKIGHLDPTLSIMTLNYVNNWYEQTDLHKPSSIQIYSTQLFVVVAVSLRN